MPDATTRGPWDDVRPKATEVLDPALEKIKWGLEETLRARDAEIRELKAALDQMIGQFDECRLFMPGDNKSYLHFKWEGYGIDGHYCADAPELTRYLCDRNGWPNPLEGGEG